VTLAEDRWTKHYHAFGVWTVKHIIINSVLCACSDPDKRKQTVHVHLVYCIWYIISGLKKLR